jgi:hypothetical protein
MTAQELLGLIDATAIEARDRPHAHFLAEAMRQVIKVFVHGGQHADSGSWVKGHWSWVTPVKSKSQTHYGQANDRL